MPTYKLAMEMQLAGQTMYNIWFVEHATGGSVILDAVTEFLVEKYQEHVAPGQVNDLQYTQLLRQRVDIGGQPVAPFGGFVPFTGESPSAPLPTQVAFGLAMKSYAPKPNKGYKYFPGMAAPNLSEFVWGTATMDRMTDFGLSILGYNAAYPTSARFCIVRYDAATHSYLFPNTINAMTPKAIPSTLRRRKIGVGM